MCTSSFLLAEVTQKERSSILSPSHLKKSWRQGHQKGVFLPRQHMLLLSSCLQLPHLHLLFPGRSHGATPSHYPPSHPHAQTFGDTCWVQPSRPPPPTTSTDSDNWLWRLIAEHHISQLSFWSCYSMFTFSPSLFLEAISIRVWKCVVAGGKVAVVCLCEQGAVSPNKYTRRNGRRDLFDHTLSKEIFDFLSSLFLFLYLSSQSVISFRRVVKRIPIVGTDQLEWVEVSWEFWQFSLETVCDQAWRALFTVDILSDFNHWLSNSSSSPVWLQPTRIFPKVF